MPAGLAVPQRRLRGAPNLILVALQLAGLMICGLVSLPFAWTPPSMSGLGLMMVVGAIGVIGYFCVNRALQLAPASVVAPFDYSSMLWALLLGYWLFGELPTALVYVGACIVAGAGLFVIWRERQLGLQRTAEAEGPRTPEISA